MSLNIILAGVGGQGILFSTRILAGAAARKGEEVLISETHGMSQRGGSVLSHLKIGKTHSPLIRRGTADILYVFEEKEIFGNLSFLKEKGLVFINAPEKIKFPEALGKTVQAGGFQIHSLDASQITKNLGNTLSTNLILMGFSLAFGIPGLEREEVRFSIEEASSSPSQEGNLRALEEGYQAGIQYKQEVRL